MKKIIILLFCLFFMGCSANISLDSEKTEDIGSTETQGDTLRIDFGINPESISISSDNISFEFTTNVTGNELDEIMYVFVDRKPVKFEVDSKQLDYLHFNIPTQGYTNTITIPRNFSMGESINVMILDSYINVENPNTEDEVYNHLLVNFDINLELEGINEDINTNTFTTVSAMEVVEYPSFIDTVYPDYDELKQVLTQTSIVFILNEEPSTVKKTVNSDPIYIYYISDVEYDEYLYLSVNGYLEKINGIYDAVEVSGVKDKAVIFEVENDFNPGDKISIVSIPVDVGIEASQAKNNRTIIVDTID